MDARQEKGLIIAATMKIQQKGDGWTVPSQTTLVKKYSVTRVDDTYNCTCPDFELRRLPCKHTFAVEYHLRGETTITTPDGAEATVSTETRVRMTYPQNSWPAYNAAQTSEGELFPLLLRDLCSGVPEPEHHNGRPPVPLSDAIFAGTYRAYANTSARRFMSAMRDVHAQGFVSRPMHFNTLLNSVADPALTPTLQRLITTSAAPLRAVEHAFAVDSTGLSTSVYYNHFTHKYGSNQTFRSYTKLHALVAVRTNVIAAATATHRDVHDSTQFIPLIENGAKMFTMSEVSADKAYSGRANVTAVTELGAAPFIPFKSNAIDDPKCPAWSKLFHLFSYRSEEFMEHYHKRSNAESAFSSLKRLFSDNLRSKTEDAQKNELLLKALAYNITRVIHAIFELDVQVPGLSACTKSVLAVHNVGGF
jgi:transposase